MKDTVIALKVDVDTHTGTGEGVPRLLDILDRFDIKATFFFSMGPDNSGRAIRRIFTQKGFLGKMIRTKAPSTYGLRTMLYGTILPAPMIAESFPEVLTETARRGHETGIHCWDHVTWHDLLPRMPDARVRAELAKAQDLYTRIFGRNAAATAAPGWTVSKASLAAQDEMNLDYCSDTRGAGPFFPNIDGVSFKTLQIPSTLPTMDELIGTDGATPGTVNQRYLQMIRPGLNVHTIHAEMEGMSMAGIFEDLLFSLKRSGNRFATLAEVAANMQHSTIPSCRIIKGELPGRAGKVALQGEEVVSL
jgi:peptidoglycan/xylan/chitin deacetylase (PgdA/CDA1 family)